MGTCAVRFIHFLGKHTGLMKTERLYYLALLTHYMKVISSC
uniref:Uncharacterized protein At2g01220At2g01230 n=1 Tax=Arabidopsis thaliana TaxID=3702 RepID=Q8H192_ARATH|nr:unknown protein [Arabidopsis thaliana]